MAVGKNKRMSKGGKRGAKKKVVEPMLRKEWYDVVAPANFEKRQFAKTICNKTQGLKIAADNLRGRVYEVNQADLVNDAPTKDQAFRNVKFEVMTADGYTPRLFVMAFTKKQKTQLSKNCYSKT